jgi:hypothetical protein
MMSVSALEGVRRPVVISPHALSQQRSFYRTGYQRTFSVQVTSSGHRWRRACEQPERSPTPVKTFRAGSRCRTERRRPENRPEATAVDRQAGRRSSRRKDRRALRQAASRSDVTRSVRRTTRSCRWHHDRDARSSTPSSDGRSPSGCSNRPRLSRCRSQANQDGPTTFIWRRVAPGRQAYGRARPRQHFARFTRRAVPAAQEVWTRC